MNTRSFDECENDNEIQILMGMEMEMRNPKFYWNSTHYHPYLLQSLTPAPIYIFYGFKKLHTFG